MLTLKTVGVDNNKVTDSRGLEPNLFKSQNIKNVKDQKLETILLISNISSKFKLNLDKKVITINFWLLSRLLKPSNIT